MNNYSGTKLPFCVLAAVLCSVVPTQGQQQSQTQVLVPQAGESLAEAARRIRAEKPRHEAGRVYTSEDLSRLLPSGVSVVGQEPAAAADAPGTANSTAVKSDRNAEGLWRERISKLKAQMSEVDDKIERVNRNIANANGNGYAITIADLDLSLPGLLREEEQLQKQIDQLEEEGRKAGTDPGWFR
jgi:chromosome segregation ATPase